MSIEDAVKICKLLLKQEVHPLVKLSAESLSPFESLCLLMIDKVI